VLSVNHYFDGHGNYNNDFSAVPAGIKTPPVKSALMPFSETQSALVTDNFDPKGLGRIRVKFHWMNGAEKTPWIRVTSPHGGQDKGMYFMPEVGEEVIVGFEGGSPTKPYMIGSVYHGKANNSFGNAGNDVKALQTRSGTKIIMNDKEGSILVEDKDGNSILLDGKGNITVKSNDTVTIDAKNQITLKTKLISMEAEDQITMNSKVLDGQFSETATLYGTNEMNVGSQSAVNVTSDNKVSVGASVEVEVFGKTKVGLASDGAMEANGALMTTIQGGQVKLNC
jgi:uncharacterized protein involved in type VI secretion and phage assembly